MADRAIKHHKPRPSHRCALSGNLEAVFGKAHHGRESTKPANVDSPPRPAWGVQLIGNSSQIAALASFYKLQKTYASVLGSHEPLVLRSSAGRNASWYRVRIGADTRGDAERLCSSLRAVGSSCLVQMN